MDHKKFEPVKTNNWWEYLGNNASNIKKTLAYNQVVDGNNRAHKQQEADKLKRYLLSVSIHYTKEEIEEFLRKYNKK